MPVLYQQNSGIEAAPLQDEVILFHPTSGKFFVLNKTSSFIWSNLREPSTSQQISDKMLNSFRKTEEANLARDIDSVLQEMVSQGLIIMTQP
jgi:hypothetical protein